MRAQGSVYMHWAKLHAAARFNLANSGLLACTTAELGAEPARVAPRRNCPGITR